VSKEEIVTAGAVDDGLRIGRTFKSGSTCSNIEMKIVYSGSAEEPVEARTWSLYTTCRRGSPCGKDSSEPVLAESGRHHLWTHYSDDNKVC